jgi:arginyl-tRNA synthetase
MKEIHQLIVKAVEKLGLSATEFKVEHPKDESHGDYSCNVALILSKQGAGNPKDLADKIVSLIANDIEVNRLIARVETAGPGFINFYLNENFLVEQAQAAGDEGYGFNASLKGQKTFVEFTDPNPFKEFHIGHLMSNTIGESLARILEANGASVKRANYQGDVGLHVAKSIWGWKQKMQEEGKTLGLLKTEDLKSRVAYLGAAYAFGAGKYEENERVKAEINSLNKEIYEGLSQKRDDLTMALYHEGRAWSLEYFETIYKRLGTKFDEYFFESEAGPVGLEVVEEALQKGVLTIGTEGAVIFPGEQYGLHTRVFRNKLGLPTYEAKDLGLAKTKWGRWKYDRSYIVTANEIDEYFKVLLKTLSLLYPDLAAKTTHLSHGMMKLTTGKMSSRTGKVITGEGLLNELQEVVKQKMGERQVENKEVVADLVAVAALKYTVLKQAIGGDITYEPEKITNMEGDTGPYLQYTFARTQSVLKKAGDNKEDTLINDKLNGEELSVLKWIYRYGEVVLQAGEKYAPHLLAGYIYELAQRYNTMYNQHQIVGNGRRVMITKAVGAILKSGLGLLGITATETM